MSQENPQASINSLILTLFPIHPRALNEQVNTHIFSEIQKILETFDHEFHEIFQALPHQNQSQVTKIKAIFYENIIKIIEELKQARKRQFRYKNHSVAWWPSPDEIFLSNQIPACSHAFIVQEETFFFVLKESNPYENIKNSRKKKYYFLSKKPIQQSKSLITIFFQFRSPNKVEDSKFGKFPKQEQINAEILNKLNDLLKGKSYKPNPHSNSSLSILSFHLNLFTQKKEPVILYKNLCEYHNKYLMKSHSTVTETLVQRKNHLGINKKVDHETLDQIKSIETSFLKKMSHLLVGFENLLISIWEKKSRITQTDYIISLDKIIKWLGRDFLANNLQLILSNAKQMNEWMNLYKIDFKSIETQVNNPNGHPLFPLDTRFFNSEFKKDLLDSLPNLPLEELLDGYVYKSDNWYALNSLQALWHNKIKCIYIDPPYNTGNEDFMYKDNFSRHEWMVMLRNRLEVAKTFLSEEGVIIISIDDNEMANLKLLLDQIFEENSIGPIIVQTNPRGRTLDKHLAKTHEYLLIYAINKEHVNTLFKIAKNEEQLAKFNKIDEKGRVYRLIELRNRNPRFNRSNRPNLFYPFYTNPKSNRVSLTFSEEYPVEILPKTSRNTDDCWTWSKEKTSEHLEILESKKVSTGAWRVFRRNYLDEGGKAATTNEKSIWIEGSLSNERGREQLRDLFGVHIHDYPKSVDYIERIVRLATADNHMIMDFFAGSGTTAHAVLAINQKKHTKNKFILIEKSNQVENVILPRIKKLSYAYDWKNGFPVNKNGQGVFIQYQRLEQPLEDFFTKIILDRFNPRTQIRYQFKGFKLQGS